MRLVTDFENEQKAPFCKGGFGPEQFGLELTAERLSRTGWGDFGGATLSGWLMDSGYAGG